LVKVYEELENSAFEGTIIDIETIGDFEMTEVKKRLAILEDLSHSEADYKQFRCTN